MIEYPDNEVVESFARIRHDPDFVRIIKWLRTEQESVARRSMIMDSKELARMQGAYLAMQEILNVADDAVNVINAAHERKKKGRTHIP
jgi:hypothetical protein